MSSRCSAAFTLLGFLGGCTLSHSVSPSPSLLVLPPQSSDAISDEILRVQEDPLLLARRQVELGFQSLEAMIYRYYENVLSREEDPSTLLKQAETLLSFCQESYRNLHEVESFFGYASSPKPSVFITRLQDATTFTVGMPLEERTVPVSSQILRVSLVDISAGIRDIGEYLSGTTLRVYPPLVHFVFPDRLHVTAPYQKLMRFFVKESKPFSSSVSLEDLSFDFDARDTLSKERARKLGQWILGCRYQDIPEKERSSQMLQSIFTVHSQYAAASYLLRDVSLEHSHRLMITALGTLALLSSPADQDLLLTLLLHGYSGSENIVETGAYLALGKVLHQDDSDGNFFATLPDLGRPSPKRRHYLQDGALRAYTESLKAYAAK